MKRAILFLLKNLKDQPDFGPFKNEWYATSAPNSEHALQALSQNSFEAVVVDASFQTSDELPFLSRALNRAPATKRMVLCDLADGQALPSETTVHQYLHKPCSAESVIAALERSCLVEKWLRDPQIKRLHGLMRKLPSVPSIYFRLLKELQSPDSDIEAIGRIVSEDLVLTAKVLQVVNSALFAFHRNITNPIEAVFYLGIERVKALALVSHSFSNYAPPKGPSFSIDRLWQHSMATAQLAQMIASEESGDVKVAEASFTAGLLHDIGKLMIAVNLPNEYQAALVQAQRKQTPFFDSERELLGATHAEVGACVMGTWGLPSIIVESIGFQHRPQDYFDKSFSPVTAVHLANTLEHETNRQAEQDPPQKLHLGYLASLGLDKRLDFWRETVRASSSQTGSLACG